MEIFEKVQKLTSYGSGLVASETFRSEKFIYEMFNQMWPNHVAVTTKCANLVIGFANHQRSLCRTNDLESYYYGLHAILSQINRVELRGEDPGQLPQLFMALMEAAVGTGVYLGDNDDDVKNRILGSLISEVGADYRGLQRQGDPSLILLARIKVGEARPSRDVLVSPGDAFSLCVRVVKRITRSGLNEENLVELDRCTRDYYDAVQKTYPFQRSVGTARLVDGLLAQVGVSGASES